MIMYTCHFSDAESLHLTCIPHVVSTCMQRNFSTFLSRIPQKEGSGVENDLMEQLVTGAVLEKSSGGSSRAHTDHTPCQQT